MNTHTYTNTNKRTPNKTKVGPFCEEMNKVRHVTHQLLVAGIKIADSYKDLVHRERWLIGRTRFEPEKMLDPL